MATNLLVLDGIIRKTPTRKHSPSGIPHLMFSLEHQSTQIEAGLPRNAFVAIQVVLSGDIAQQYAQQLQAGNSIRVTGFLTRHESKDGVAKLVLHAQQIERTQ